jgi:stage III sporulation protein AG
MDRIDFAKSKSIFRKYKYVLLILVLGVILMLLPEKDQPIVASQPTTAEATPVSRTQELEDILGQIAGVGKVRVLLTEASGAETVYQTNEDQTASGDSQSIRTEAVIITDSSREEAGLVRTVTPPIYLGAIIVCQGGDNPTVRLSIVEAVSDVTGLGSDRITVLKMK